METSSMAILRGSSARHKSHWMVFHSKDNVCWVDLEVSLALIQFWRHFRWMYFIVPAQLHGDSRGFSSEFVSLKQTRQASHSPSSSLSSVKLSFSKMLSSAHRSRWVHMSLTLNFIRPRRITSPTQSWYPFEALQLYRTMYHILSNWGTIRKCPSTRSR